MMSLLSSETYASFMPVNDVCLHPMEELALFGSQKRSVEDEIKALEEQQKAVDESIKYVKGKKYENENKDLDSLLTKLENSLVPISQQNNSIDQEDITSIVSEYIEGRYSSLDEIDGEDSDEDDNDWAVDDDLIEKARLYEEDPLLDEKLFKKEGNIDQRKFCEKYASEKKERRCRNAINDLEELYDELDEYKIQRAEITNKINELEAVEWRIKAGLPVDEEYAQYLEAGGPCWECLDQLRELDKPTASQAIGSVGAFLGGAALSYYGYRAGKRAAPKIDKLRLRQGFDPLGHAHMSWAGATLGLPFMSLGVHGLAGGNSVFGSHNCSPGFATGSGIYGPFSHYNMNPAAILQAQAMYGQNPVFNAGLQLGGSPYAMLNPFGMGGLGASGGFQLGGMPFGMGGLGASGGFQLGGMPFGMGGLGASGGFQLGGMPFGMGGLGAGGGFQLGGMPFGMGGLGAGGGFQLGGMPFGMGGLGVGGGFQLGGMPFGMGGLGAGGGFQLGGMPFGMGGGLGGFGGGFPGMMNPAMMQLQMQQQQYTQYLQMQQQQIQFRLQAQQAWLKQQQSIQQDRMRRQEVIGGLVQEMGRIQQQIQLVASGGINNSALGTFNTNFNTGWNVGENLVNNQVPGTSTGPSHQPAVTNKGTSSGDYKVIRE